MNEHHQEQSTEQEKHLEVSSRRKPTRGCLSVLIVTSFGSGKEGLEVIKLLFGPAKVGTF